MVVRLRSAAVPVTKRAGSRRKCIRNRKIPEKEEWLNWKFIRAIKKMKLAGIRLALKPGITIWER